MVQVHSRADERSSQPPGAAPHPSRILPPPHPRPPFQAQKPSLRRGDADELAALAAAVPPAVATQVAAAQAVLHDRVSAVRALGAWAVRRGFGWSLPTDRGVFLHPDFFAPAEAADEADLRAAREEAAAAAAAAGVRQPAAGTAAAAFDGDGAHCSAMAAGNGCQPAVQTGPGGDTGTARWQPDGRMWATSQWLCDDSENRSDGDGDGNGDVPRRGLGSGRGNAVAGGAARRAAGLMAARRVHPTWSVGVYTSRGPTDGPLDMFSPDGYWLEVEGAAEGEGAADRFYNPVMSPADVLDVEAGTVADPFMLWREEDALWHMFMEVQVAGIRDFSKRRGVIGHATSRDGFRWEYNGIVLDTPEPEMWHLSYPYVWEDQGRVFMLPESKHVEAVRLFVADPFPSRWRVATVIATLPGGFADPSIVQHPVSGLWFLFLTSGDNSQLLLLFAPDPMGPWEVHPSSPIVVGDRRRTRCGGRVVVTQGGRIFRMAQDLEPIYGRGLRTFEVTTLTPASFVERLVSGHPSGRPGHAGVGATGRVTEWNGEAMHHMDAHQRADGSWVALVDGRGVFQQLFASAAQRLLEGCAMSAALTRPPLLRASGNLPILAARRRLAAATLRYGAALNRHRAVQYAADRAGHAAVLDAETGGVAGSGVEKATGAGAAAMENLVARVTDARALMEQLAALLEAELRQARLVGVGARVGGRWAGLGWAGRCRRASLPARVLLCACVRGCACVTMRAFDRWACGRAGVRGCAGLCVLRGGGDRG